MPNMPGHIDFVSGVGSADQIANFTSPFATFKTGRVDCDTSPSTEVVHEFPEPHMNHDELFTFMNPTHMSSQIMGCIEGRIT